MTVPGVDQQDGARGLTTAEADARRRSGGSNALETEVDHPARRALSKLWAPVPWMLEATIAFQLIIGEYPEAAVIGVLLVFNGGISLYQEGRAHTTLTALTSRLALTSSALRDGKWVTVPAASLVPGDVVTLSLGSIVPADVRILGGSVLVDESMLTGESIPTEAGTGADSFAGALVRRGEATAEVVSTGTRTRFGQSAELIRTAHVKSSEQKAVFRVVRDLGIFNGAMTVILVVYALLLKLPLAQIAPLAVVAVVASIPVALPSMFTLAATLGARALARRGVLPTRLSALDEAAGIDVLILDKTGTLTVNSLSVAACDPAPGFTNAQLLALAALASSPSGADPVDQAVRKAAGEQPADTGLVLTRFHPFDPSAKMSSASARAADGTETTVMKGAYAVIAALTSGTTTAAESADHLEKSGFRVLAVAVGPSGSLRHAGLIGLSDPPRPESRDLISRLRALGIRTIMATGDAERTADVVADAVGITGARSAISPVAAATDVERIGVYATVLPADKFAVVEMLQHA
nr:HAD-IC family P-type ATPase [Acidobacteriota bacterium]